MTIYAYMRFSSENQTNNTSIETQRDAIGRYVQSVAELRGMPITEMIDEAKSATTLKGRLALQSIRQQAVRGDAVVVFKLDRLGRNLLDSLQVLSEFENQGVRVYSTSEPEMPLVRHILLATAEEFSRSLGDRCRRALNTLASSGNAANKPPFGYRIQRDPQTRRGKLVPVPEQAEVILRIFQLRAQGSSHREIAKALNESVTASPKGTDWNMACIGHILKNETYRGTIISGQRKFKKGHGLQGFRPRSEWSICENAHEPIVTEELWLAVRSRDGAKHQKATVRTRQLHAWTGFLKCAKCGGNLTRHTSKDVHYYGCESGRKYGVKRDCQHRSLIRVDTLTDLIIETMLKHIPMWLDEILAKCRKEMMRARESVGSVISPLEDTIKRLDKQIESAERRLIHIPETSLPIALDEVKQMRRERDDVQEKLASIKKVANNPFTIDELEENARQQLARLPEMFTTPSIAEVRQSMVRFIEKVEVWPNKKARLYGQPDLLMQLGVGSNNIPSGI